MSFTLLSVGVARGETNSVEARRHYDEGNTAYSLGEFVRAAEEYKAAYKIKQDPAFLYNIAQAYRLANDPTNALFFYRSFLRNLPNATNRREVEDRIAKLEAQLAARDALVKSPPNATMPPSGGGRAVTAPPVEPKAAPVASVAPTPPAPTPGAEPPSTSPAPAPTPAVTPSLDLTAAPTSPPPARTPVYKKWWLWTAVGVLVAGAAAGTTAGIMLSRPGAPGSHFGTVSVYQ